MLTRPTTIAEVKSRLKQGRVSEACIENALSFKPRPTDVIISPFAKSGTTWLQQIVHGLRTRGSMDFDEITSVVPWLETALELGLDIHDEQVANPRAYKSHFDWQHVPKGGKYIYSIRDPKDVLVSFYHFFEGWWFETGTVSMADFANEMVMDDPDNSGYWQHVLSWWEQRDNPAILFLCFEEMKTDLAGTIRRVADFIDIPLDDELFEIVYHQSAIEFMKAHEKHFDDHLMRIRHEVNGILPKGGNSSKVRKGKVGEYRQELNSEILAELGRIWQATFSAKYGYQSYQDLRDTIKARG